VARAALGDAIFHRTPRLTDVTESEPELVVLLAEDGTPIGTAAKDTVHHTATPLHLAFSCWLFDSGGRVLLTRRAWCKSTWPGVWTNSFCGHPAPGERLGSAVARRARHELGIVSLTDLTPRLPDFRYRATMPDGIMENEICPVFSARITGEVVQPNPVEVAELRWVTWDELRTLVRCPVRDTSAQLSPWLVKQFTQWDADR
jgi:isopentenyl-diphosphate Delta-isomerase